MEEAIGNSSDIVGVAQADADKDTEPTEKSPATKKKKSRIEVIPERSTSSPQVKLRSASLNHKQNEQQSVEDPSTD